MWYFAWILGTLLACTLSIITALAFEYVEEGNVEGNYVEVNDSANEATNEASKEQRR